MTLSLNIATFAQYGLNVKRSWLLSIFAFALGMLHTSSMAQCTSSGGTISTAVNSTCTLTSGTLTITGTGSITTSLANASGDAISNSGTTTIINNNGSISTSGSGAYGVYNDSNKTITTLSNTGSISTLGSNAYGVGNSGTITTLNNTGSISTSGSNAYGVGNFGTITTLNNTGSISTIGSGAIGIGNLGTIGTLNNTGSISASGTSAFGISNLNTITTLNNQQGKSGNNPLTYTGRLPVNYNIIIAGSTNYGQLSISNATGSMVFGIYSPSTTSNSIVGQTLTGVLRGFLDPLSNWVTGLTQVGSTAAYTYSSANYSYSLTEQGSTGIWDLIVTACSICNTSSSGGSSGSTTTTTSTPTITNITTGSTVTVTSLGTTYNPVLAGGTLVLSNGNSTSVPITITSAGGTIQSPSSGSATLSGALTGSGGLTFTGTGTTILTGANTYSGGTTVSSGTLQGNTTSLQGSITNNGKVVFDQPSTGTFSGTIAGSGAVVVQNSGTVVLTGANTYTGGTTVSSGTLQGNTTSLQGSITNNGKVVFDQPSTGTFSGTIAGSGAVVVQNSGTVVLTGANSYTGGTTVSGGTLSVAGTAPTGTGDVVISSPSTLMGTGTIAGNGIVSGVLKPGNSPGYLSFAQNLTLNAGSTYQQDIAGTVQASSATPVGASGYYSFVSVGSQLTIDSGATLTPRLSNLFTASESGYGSSIYVPMLGDMFRIVTAAGGITGRFTNLTQPAELSSGTQFIAFYNVNSSNSLDLVTVPTSYSTTLSSSTTNAMAVAGVLDQLLGVNKAGTASSAQDSLLYSAAGQTAASLPTFAQALAGEIHAASVATLPQTTQRVQQSVLARLGDYPMAPSQINPALNNALLTGAISATNPSGLPTANMSTNPAVNPNTVNVTSAAVADGRAWGEIAYQHSERSSNSTGNGYNSNLYQIVTGVDAYSNAELGLKLGGGISLSNTTVTATGGNSTIQQGSLFVYGKMSVLQDYVLDGMASVGLSSTNLSRNDPTGDTGGFSSKAVMGNDALVSMGISRAFEYNEVRVTPYARLTYQYVGQNSYDEGNGVAALNIARFSGSAVRGVIGVAAGSLNKDPLKDDYTYRANVAVGADTSGLLNPTLNTTLGGYSSSVTTATAGSAFVQVGLYGTVKIADNAYAYAGVSGEARSGQTLYGGSVGLRIAF